MAQFNFATFPSTNILKLTKINEFDVMKYRFFLFLKDKNYD